MIEKARQLLDNELKTLHPNGLNAQLNIATLLELATLWLKKQEDICIMELKTLHPNTLNAELKTKQKTYEFCGRLFQSVSQGGGGFCILNGLGNKMHLGV